MSNLFKVNLVSLLRHLEGSLAIIKDGSRQRHLCLQLTDLINLFDESAGSLVFRDGNSHKTCNSSLDSCEKKEIVSSGSVMAATRMSQAKIKDGPFGSLSRQRNKLLTTFGRIYFLQDNARSNASLHDKIPESHITHFTYCIT